MWGDTNKGAPDKSRVPPGPLLAKCNSISDTNWLFQLLGD